MSLKSLTLLTNYNDITNTGKAKKKYTPTDYYCYWNTILTTNKSKYEQRKEYIYTAMKYYIKAVWVKRRT